MREESGGSGGSVTDRLAPVLRPVRAGNGFEEALEQILQVVRLGLVAGASGCRPSGSWRNGWGSAG